MALVEASQGGSGVRGRALPVSGSWLSGRSNAGDDPVTFHTARLTAAGSPRGKAFIWVKRVLATAHAVCIFSFPTEAANGGGSDSSLRDASPSRCYFHLQKIP